MAGHRPAATGGVFELPTRPDEPVFLAGEWGFAWERFVDPNWQALPTTALADVPGDWNELTADNKPNTAEGWGSYVLQVNCPAGQSLALDALPQRTASRLFVNGIAVAQHGRPGATAGQSWAAVHDRIPLTREFACPLRITLHVSNFDHRAGGFVRALGVGPIEVLERHREVRMAGHVAVITAYALTGVVSLLFFAVRRREWVPLMYGLFCLSMAIYTDALGERLLLRPLPPQIAWSDYMRLEYLAWVAAMSLFLMTLRGLFPADIPRRVVTAVLLALGAATVAVLVLPPAVYSHLAVPGQAAAVLVSGYLAWVMMRTARQNRADARILLGGMVAVVGAMVLDLLLIDVASPDRKFGPFGFALFLLSPALVIARRMSHALNAEERSRTLQENARLREDVERISRHDLKTPLNSILGVARLLQDDTGLNAEQRELVGVLQRAGLRMLEMVNLSLGLYRMETGTYVFRPQSVDLRQVVGRVLVDLRSVAQSAGVSLRLASSDGTAVQVRAEELLCYSILANLVKNAIEACAPGEQVTLTIQPGDPVRLSIHNPGEVPPSVAERFFQKYLASSKHGGAGLGTYSARLMARAQQGEVAMRTSAFEGTTLTLSLRPAKSDTSTPRPEIAASHTPIELDDQAPREVLLVDDDEFSRLVTSHLLPHPPYHVETAATGQAAIDGMMKRWPHLLLLDMEMPGMDGVDTLRWVREHESALSLPRCHVVMLSGNDDEASADRALEAGADRFLVKPVDRDLLLATLDELCQRAAAGVRG